jgi:hypothetical protein
MVQQHAIASSYSLLGGCHVGRDDGAIIYVSYGISHTGDEDALMIRSRQADKVRCLVVCRSVVDISPQQKEISRGLSYFASSCKQE